MVLHGMLLSRNCLPEQESRICLHLELFGHGGEMERGDPPEKGQ